MQNPVKELMKFADAHGVKVIAKGIDHYQIIGKLLVNYYPNSENRTAYVAGTVKGKKNVTPQQAVQMSMFAPKPVKKDAKAKRKSNTRKLRFKMLKGQATCKCYWCETVIDIDTSTLEHVIPLHLGGLDNGNNRVLACRPCNEKRGHAMPELKEEK